MHLFDATQYATSVCRLHPCQGETWAHSENSLRRVCGMLKSVGHNWNTITQKPAISMRWQATCKLLGPIISVVVLFVGGSCRPTTFSHTTSCLFRLLAFNDFITDARNAANTDPVRSPLRSKQFLFWLELEAEFNLLASTQWKPAAKQSTLVVGS